MRETKEIRRALAVLGAALANPDARRFVWGSWPDDDRPDSEREMNHAMERAWFAWGALRWALGADDSPFAGLLEHVREKLTQYYVREKADVC